MYLVRVALFNDSSPESRPLAVADIPHAEMDAAVTAYRAALVGASQAGHGALDFLSAAVKSARDAALRCPAVKHPIDGPSIRCTRMNAAHQAVGEKHLGPNGEEW